MENLTEVLRKIAQYSLANKEEFEALVKSSLAKEQTEEIKKQKKRIPQITERMEQIERIMNKLYEDNALGNIEPKRYEQLSGKYAEEYYSLKAEQEQIEERLSEFENANQRAKNFIKLAESYSDFEELTPTAINEFISKIVVHERDVKRVKYAVQRIEVYFNYIGKFENELTKQIEPTEQEMIQMREEIEEAKKEKARAYRRQYYKEYRAKNIEKCREYEKEKAREYRAKKKLQATT
ncbi:PF14287 domain protein [Peptostreptococcaceae bacterium AS15]|nr:PF14287 domain protein [Peptostreptococcaceae bacterium AS15]